MRGLCRWAMRSKHGPIAAASGALVEEEEEEEEEEKCKLTAMHETM